VSAFTFSLPTEAAKRVEKALAAEGVQPEVMDLFCQKCYKLTQHNEIEFRCLYPEVAGLPVQNIAATCSICGLRDVAGFVVLLNAEGAGLCTRTAAEWDVLPALTGTKSRGS